MNKKQLARLRKNELKSWVMDFFQENYSQSFNYKQVSAAFGITRQMSRLMIDDILHELWESRFLIEEKEGKYRIAVRPREVRKILGDDIMTEFNLPEEYPEAAVKEAEGLEEDIIEKDFTYRDDFRHVLTFTIDPQDAKDFDDALSLRPLENGHWEVGVHIADVTYYVKSGGPIDKEAERRATSVYLVDRTIPMLPEKLCNQICSLRPDEDKRCFSCVFEMNDEAKVLNYRIVRTVIRSNQRLCYEEAQEAIDEAQGQGESPLNPEIKQAILTLNGLAKKIREQRFRNGAIQFDSTEIRFRTDENGKPLEIYFREATESHNLIEEFMLLANKTVAEFVGKKGTLSKAFVYRVHDLPDKEKLKGVSKFIRRFGYHLITDGSRKEVCQSINQLLTKIHGKKEEGLISSLTVRAMAKAVYTTENIGHYGLAFSHYTHFTSPIRRYPDMMVHRLLERYLNNQKSVNKDLLEEKCEHCSEMEQLAVQAERASVKVKQIEYLSERLGTTYAGVITGVTEFGFFVELLDNKCEGLVGIRDLEDDHYDFDERNYCLRGRRHKKIYRIGDLVYVLVARTNMDRRQLDFVLTDAPEKDEEAE